MYKFSIYPVISKLFLQYIQHRKMSLNQACPKALIFNQVMRRIRGQICKCGTAAGMYGLRRLGAAGSDAPKGLSSRPAIGRRSHWAQFRPYSLARVHSEAPLSADSGIFAREGQYRGTLECMAYTLWKIYSGRTWIY